MRTGLELLPTWALEQKAAANRQVIAVMRQRLAAGEQVARMYHDPGLAWLERQAECGSHLGVECGCVSAGTAWLQGVRRLFAACCWRCGRVRNAIGTEPGHTGASEMLETAPRSWRGSMRQGSWR
jgi:hypothetical protein